MHFIPDTIIRALCWTLLHSLWQGLLFAGVAGVVLVVTRKSHAALRYNLLCGGLLLFLVVSGYTFYRELGMSVVVETGRVTVDAGVKGGHGVTAAPDAGATFVSRSGVTAGIDALVGYFNTHAALVVLIWGIVFLARWVQLLSGWVYAQRIRHYKNQPAPEEWQQRLGRLLEKLGIARPVSLLESALVKVPVVVGMLKPVILVPMGMLVHLSADQVESILLHELAHIRRKDYLFNFIQHVIDTMFFFNPALRWISSLIRAERENCCDDIAIRETGSRRRLIEALVSFHEYGQTTGCALGFAAKENQVVRRVKRIVEKTNHSLNAGERIVLMGGIMVLSAAFVTIHNSRTEKTRVVAETRVVAKAQPEVVTVVRHFNAKNVDRRHKAIVDTVPKEAKQKAMAQKDTVPKEDIDKLIEARDHGVTAEFIAGFDKMGYKHISIDKAIELADHGVSTDFIAGIIAEGYAAPISLDLALELKDHGVTVGFIRELHGLGFPAISLEKAIELVDHGVTIGFISSWKKKIGKLLEPDDYIKLRDAGISPTS
ncbi:MAG TPA: M56 family metallopeptidase [Puia sp.]|jgi:beta-lactamase regulating signal transducer with metallopeptidase domain|nr:M56 family metallopeptidase [Puia sp.]